MNIKQMTLGILLAASTSSTFCGWTDSLPTRHDLKEGSKELLRKSTYTLSAAALTYTTNFLLDYLPGKNLIKDIVIKEKIKNVATAAIGTIFTAPLLKKFVKEPKDSAILTLGGSIGTIYLTQNTLGNPIRKAE